MLKGKVGAREGDEIHDKSPPGRMTSFTLSTVFKRHGSNDMDIELRVIEKQRSYTRSSP